MQFRLIYRGPLPAETSKPRVKYKHAIRKFLHPQLRELWQQHDFLRHNVNYHAAQFHRCGYRFVPLISTLQAKRCALDILFLRRDAPGNIVASGGDIDNRIKVLFDGLKMVESANQLPPDAAAPGLDEDPFFCLLQDDSLITEVKITTDRLLESPSPSGNVHDVELIIHVRTPAIDFGDE